MSSDEYIYRSALKDANPIAYAQSRDILYLNDSNSGRYNGQIIFESVNLGSGRDLYQSWSEAVVVIPYVISVSGSTLAAAASQYFAGLKNGYYHIIDSCKVEYGNKTVQENQSLINHFVNFKVMSSWSQSDLDKWGIDLGVEPDTATSYTRHPASVSGAPGTAGAGFANNRDFIVNPVVGTAGNSTNASTNLGYLKRKQQNTAYLNTGLGLSGFDAANGPLAANNVGANLAYQTAGKNHCVTTATLNYWVVLAQIRLKDICSFAELLPCVKNTNMKITITYNSATVVLNRTANLSVSFNSYTQLSGNSNPIQVGSFNFVNNSGEHLAAAANNVITITSGVCYTSLNPAPATLPMQQCRIYLPCYTWNPQYEAKLVETAPQKTIMYNDIYQYQFNVASNSNFNQIVISSQRTPLYLVVIPYPAASNYSNLSFEAYQSVFESAPGTTGPLAYISQFNVLLGSKPVFTMNKDYDFENFQDEICKINAINGGNSTGLSSGLISFDDFTYAYRYYVCDLSRRMDINDPTSPSIAIIGKNSSGYDMRLVCFVVYGKQATINMLDGSIV